MPAYRVLPIPLSMDFSDTEKPYVECISGRLEPKMSPKRTHSLLQARLAAWLDDWAHGQGEVGSEWRFYLIGGEKVPSSLVPDVAYISYERLPRDLPQDARERPRTAPDIAVEIWSPGDRIKTWQEKLALYLAHGATLVIAVHPQERTIIFHRVGGTRSFPARGKLAVPGYQDLTLDADALFQDL